MSSSLRRRVTARWTLLGRDGRLWVAGCAVLTAGLALMAWVIAVSLWPGVSFGDAVALDSLGAGLATVALAVVAGIVAVLAYAAATPQPQLEVEVAIGGAGPPVDHIVLSVQRVHPGGARVDMQLLTAVITLRNDTTFAARNPAVRISLHGLRGRILGGGPHGWLPRNVECLSAQWDGGSDYWVHGRWATQVPLLQVESYSLPDAVRGRFRMEIEFVADGVPPRIRELPIYFKGAGMPDWLSFPSD